MKNKKYRFCYNSSFIVNIITESKEKAVESIVKIGYPLENTVFLDSKTLPKIKKRRKGCTNDQ